ncbi:alanine racemase [Desulfoscipio geothermicus]|nr:alanine racemase [Desulfoscipio geothermicus]
MAVVKANAYGHGAGQVARVAMENGAPAIMYRGNIFIS